MAEKTENVQDAPARKIELDGNTNITTLTVEELYDKDKFDLSTMEQGDVLTLLQYVISFLILGLGPFCGPLSYLYIWLINLVSRTSKNGLSSEEAARRIEKFGPNKLEQKEQNPFLQFLSFMWNPLSWVMESAAIVSIAVANGEGKPPDYPDFIGIVILLLANSLIGFYEERQAGNAVKALMESLAPECKVKRDGEWKTMEAAELVPGDIISIKLGDVVPADGRLITVRVMLCCVSPRLHILILTKFCVCTP